MSALIGHAKAARIHGNALQSISRERGRAVEMREILGALADANFLAADLMEKAMRAEATGNMGDPI